MTWYHWVVFIHVMSAMLWVGGIFFVSLVAVPVARGLDERERTTLMSQLGRRFRTVGWWLLAVLWTTGLIQMHIRGATVANVLDGTFFTRNEFGRIMGSKLLLVLVMMGISLIHDFVVGPRAAEVAAAGGDPRQLRRVAAWLGRINALLALGIVGHAVVMVR